MWPVMVLKNSKEISVIVRSKKNTRDVYINEWRYTWQTFQWIGLNILVSYSDSLKLKSLKQVITI